MRLDGPEDEHLIRPVNPSASCNPRTSCRALRVRSPAVQPLIDCIIRKHARASCRKSVGESMHITPRPRWTRGIIERSIKTNVGSRHNENLESIAKRKVQAFSVDSKYRTPAISYSRPPNPPSCPPARVLTGARIEATRVSVRFEKTSRLVRKLSFPLFSSFVTNSIRKPFHDHLLTFVATLTNFQGTDNNSFRILVGFSVKVFPFI